ncbi:MAG: ComEC/Rec2 family competence protein, partial [Janthinobacterium lividum]
RHDPDVGKLRVIAIDVGQGDSTLIITPSGRTILVDGGGTSDETAAGDTDVGTKIVVPFLQFLGINRIDVLIATHPHGDHVGGLAAVVRGPQIGAVLDGTTLPYPPPAYEEFRSLLERNKIPCARAVRGQTLDMRDGVTLTVLNPPQSSDFGTAALYGTGSDDATINNYSVGLKLQYGTTRFILTGDAQNEAEGAMLGAHSDLACDVLKTGHHGSKNATGDDWLTRLQPRLSVISCGRHNRFGHPAPSTLGRLAAHGVQVYRTDQQGAITFVSDGKTVTVRPFL